MVIYPEQEKLLKQLGERLRLARLRRNMSMEMVALRADISRITLYQIEKGSPTVSMGAYLNVLSALSLQKDLSILAKDDELGRTLQDLNLKTPRRASK